MIPPGLYTWNEWLLYFQSNPSSPIFIDSLYGFGTFYDGTFNRVSLDSGFRVGARFLAAFGLLRNDIDLPGGAFVSTLVRANATYSFTVTTLVQALVPYNNQSELSSANVRFAWLERNRPVRRLQRKARLLRARKRAPRTLVHREVHALFEL